MENAAHNLLGRELQSGWTVTEKMTKGDNATGAFFSVCYKITKGKEVAFLKAFNFASFFQISDGKSIVDVMSGMLNAFKYERDLSLLCQERRVSKVAFVKEAGEENITGYTIPVVPYLIFDLADGDVRSKLEFSDFIDSAWKLNSLHSVSVGLRQLHNVNVSHQDLKPSNVLVFSGDNCKIGDIGRSMSPDMDAPHLRGFEIFSGDFNYAPPEVMYGYYEEDWKRRTQATDCYLLGSLIVFYFSGLSLNAILTKYIHPNFLWTRWNGSYEEVKPYLLPAFSDAINEFSDNIKLDFLRKELSDLVFQLCYPNPKERGHRKNVRPTGNNFNLERIIARLDYLKRKARIRSIKSM